MGPLQGTHGHVLGRVFSLDMRIKHLRSLFEITGIMLRRLDEDEDVETLMGLVRIGRDECDDLEGISKALREIADDLLRQEQEAMKKA
jgi:hypothetical protein